MKMLVPFMLRRGALGLAVAAAFAAVPAAAQEFKLPDPHPSPSLAPQEISRLRVSAYCNGVVKLGQAIPRMIDGRTQILDGYLQLRDLSKVTSEGSMRLALYKLDLLDRSLNKRLREAEDLIDQVKTIPPGPDGRNLALLRDEMKALVQKQRDLENELGGFVETAALINLQNSSDAEIAMAAATARDNATTAPSQGTVASREVPGVASHFFQLAFNVKSDMVGDIQLMKRGEERVAAVTQPAVKPCQVIQTSVPVQQASPAASALPAATASPKPH